MLSSPVDGTWPAHPVPVLVAVVRDVRARFAKRSALVDLLHLLAKLVAFALLATFLFAHRSGAEAVDAHVYWQASRTPNPYSPTTLPGDQAFQYSPAFAQLFSSLGLLPFQVFAPLWMAAQVSVLVWMIGPIVTVILILIPPVGLFDELIIGNIHIFMAAALVLTFRISPVWGFPMLTKVTPAIGLAWYAVRREWRQLAGALLTTGLIAALSFAINPEAWRTWLTWLSTMPAVPPNSTQLLASASLLLRLPAALLLIIIGARKDWRWLVPIGIWLSLPVIWYNSPILMAASIPLAKDDMRRARQRRLARAAGRPATSLGRSA